MSTLRLVKLGKLPLCDFCRRAGTQRDAHFDFVAKEGYWAFGCWEHWIQHRRSKTLGTGIGQKLEVR